MTNSCCPPYEKHTLFISKEAYQQLVIYAYGAGCIIGKRVAKGVAKYTEYIVQQKLYDNRPLYISRYDDAMIASGYAPTWSLYTPRLRRVLALSPDTMVQGSVKCMVVGITRVQRLKGDIDLFDTNKCMSALLEAIGTRWIMIAPESIQTVPEPLTPSTDT